jgi:hypothetical protein
MKRKILLVPVAILTLLMGALLPVYAASGGIWEDVGGSFKSAPGCVSWGQIE